MSTFGNVLEMRWREISRTGALVLVLLCLPHSVGRDAAAPSRSGRGGVGKPAGRPDFGLLRTQGLRGGGGGGDSRAVMPACITACSDGGGGNNRAQGWSSSVTPIGKRQAGRGEAKLFVGNHYAYARRSGKAETVFTLVQ